MKRTIPLLMAGLLFTFSSSFAQDEFEFPKREAPKVSADLKKLIEARIEDDRGDIQKYKSSLAERVEAVEEKGDAGNILKYPDAWHKIREGTIDKSNKVLKSTGKGFKLGAYTDYGQYPPKDYGFYVSLPAGYKPAGDTRFPVILFLHPDTKLKADKAEKAVFKMLKTLYSDKALLEKYIVLAPLGPMEGKGKKKKLVDAGKNWEELIPGRVTAFMGIRILLEQMVFDRSRVIVDGMGDAGLSAFRFATWYPSYFAAVIGRDAPMAPLAMENLRDIPCLYLSSPKNSHLAEAQKWAGDNKGEGEVPGVTIVEDSGDLIEPSPEAQAELLTWLEKVHKDTCPREIYLKTADLMVAASHWLKINRLNAGLDIKLDDPEYPWVEGKIDAESNSIVLKSKHVLELSVFLNDKILDLDKKVTIILNGKNRFEGKIERNLDKMIDILYDNLAGDYEIYVDYKTLTEEAE